jgi:hypothetical protein
LATRGAVNFYSDGVVTYARRIGPWVRRSINSSFCNGQIESKCLFNHLAHNFDAALLLLAESNLKCGKLNGNVVLLNTFTYVVLWFVIVMKEK